MLVLLNCLALLRLHYCDCITVTADYTAFVSIQLHRVIIEFYDCLVIAIAEAPFPLSLFYSCVIPPSAAQNMGTREPGNTGPFSNGQNTGRHTAAELML